MDVIESGNRKARKEHECSFCGGKITKGETYLYQVIRGDDIYAWKMHPRCDELTHTLEMQPDDEGLTSDGFYEYVSGAIQDLKLHEKVDALIFILERKKQEPKP